jgi:hypothetical protein
MEPPVYRQSSLYRLSAWLLVLGRLGVIALIPVLALLFWLPRDGRFVHPPAWWLTLLFSIGGLTFGAIWASVLLAAVMRCDHCGRRPTITWVLRPSASRQTEWSTIRDTLSPPELRFGRFQCVHCGADFCLRAIARKA